MHNLATSTPSLPHDLSSKPNPADNTDQEQIPISPESETLSHQPNKEEFKESPFMGNTKTESRRSVTLIPPKVITSYRSTYITSFKKQ